MVDNVSTADKISKNTYKRQVDSSRAPRILLQDVAYYRRAEKDKYLSNHIDTSDQHLLPLWKASSWTLWEFCGRGGRSWMPADIQVQLLPFTGARSFLQNQRMGNLGRGYHFLWRHYLL